MCENHAFFVSTFQRRGEIKPMFYRMPEVKTFKMEAMLADTEHVLTPSFHDASNPHIHIIKIAFFGKP